MLWNVPLFKPKKKEQFCHKNKSAVWILFTFIVTDENVKDLVERCKKLSSLTLGSPKYKRGLNVCDIIITTIIENLKLTLEELNVLQFGNISYEKLLELKSMPKLRVLNYWETSNEELENLRRYLPHLKICQRRVCVALPKPDISSKSKIWEISTSNNFNCFENVLLENNSGQFTADTFEKDIMWRS